MTLLEVERLARRLAAASSKPPEPAAALKLAEDYVAACRAASVRLRQCEAMIEVGDVAQALQLAETAPSLLDLITRLEFRESDAWRDLCDANRFPVPEPFDTRAVHRLNEAYSRGISTDDPLYKRYRGAVLKRNDGDALAILRSIVRLNPADSNAAAELARLDAKVLHESLDALRHALPTAPPAEIARLTEAIEFGGFQTRPAGADWRRAQEIRAGHLIELAATSRAANDWRPALAGLELAQQLQADFKLEFSPEQRTRFAELNRWADAQLEEHRQSEQFKAHLLELTHLIDLNEEKDTVAREVPLGEMKTDYEAMHRVWRALESLARPVPAELASRFRKRTGLLGAEISRRNRRRVLLAVTAVAAALVVGGVAVWFGLAHFRARDYVRQLAAAEQERQPRVSEKLVARLKTTEARLLGISGLSTAVTRTESFLARELGALKTFEEALAALPEKLEAGTAPTVVPVVQPRLVQTTNLLAGLAPDLRAEQEPRVTAFRNRWERWLADESAALNTDYESRLARADVLAAGLDFRRGPDAVRAALNGVLPLLAQLRGIEEALGDKLTMRPDLRQRLELASAKAGAFEKEIMKFEGALEGMRRAKSLMEFAAALEPLRTTEFSASPWAKASADWRAGEVSDEVLLQRLLCPGNPGLPAYFTSYAEDAFFPKAVMPAEAKLLEQIRVAVATGSNLFRYRLTPNGGAPPVEWLTFDKLNNTPGWKTVPTFVPSDSPASFALVTRNTVSSTVSTGSLRNWACGRLRNLAGVMRR